MWVDMDSTEWAQERVRLWHRARWPDRLGISERIFRKLVAEVGELADALADLPLALRDAALAFGVGDQERLADVEGVTASRICQRRDAAMRLLRVRLDRPAA